jgi:glycerol-3-phosphate dehydrogenase
VVAGLPYLRAELAFGVEREWAATLADLLVRRTHVAFETPDAGRAAARVAADVAGPLLGWDAAERERQLAAYGREAARLFAVDPA